MLMLDSGAFSVWSKGKKIPLRQYIEFCQDLPKKAVCVNLDVIPGEPNQPSSRTPAAIEEACKKSWKNYLRMTKYLDPKRVIPVYHMGENEKWLCRYIDHGCPYIGIGGLIGSSRKEVQRWLRRGGFLEGVRKIVLNPDGTPKMKLHGFGMTSYKIMLALPWHSVDSTTWVRAGGLGKIVVPMLRDGQWVYDEPPLILPISDSSPTTGKKAQHYLSLGSKPSTKTQVDRYLKEHGLVLGRSEIRKRDGKDQKLKGGQRWTNKDKTHYYQVLEEGVMTCDSHRKWLNGQFYMEANQVLPIKYIYLAGLGVGAVVRQVTIEESVKHRLLSYCDILSTNKCEAARAYKVHAGRLQDADEA